MYGYLTVCLHAHWKEKPKLFGLASETASIFVVCSVLIQCILISFLTMHEFESEEVKEKLGWHTLIIDYKGMRRHLLFAMPTTLKLMPFLLQNWIVLITMAGHQQLGIIWCFPLRGFKSEVMLELISKFCLTQIFISFL